MKTVLVVAVLHVVVAAMITSCPWALRAVMEKSRVDDDLAEHCYTPSKGMEAWGECKSTGKSEFPAMDDFPTGGHQVLSDGYGADPEILNDNKKLLDLLNSAAECCGSSVMSHTDHHFEPQGATLLGLLSTSHYAVHTVCFKHENETEYIEQGVASLSETLSDQFFGREGGVLYWENNNTILNDSGRSEMHSPWMSTSAHLRRVRRSCGLRRSSARLSRYGGRIGYCLLGNAILFAQKKNRGCYLVILYNQTKKIMRKPSQNVHRFVYNGTMKHHHLSFKQYRPKNVATELSGGLWCDRVAAGYKTKQHK